MARIGALSLALLMFVGCSADTEPAPEPDGTATQPPEPAKPPVPAPYDGADDGAYEGPCEPGIKYVIEDLEVSVPVACDPFWKDFGDPPPDPLGTG